MLARFVICAMICLVAFPGSAGDEATGFVFEDLDGNGRRDEGEPGVPDVSVSNGREVVRTGPDGAYRIAVEDESILFITKPAGFDVPLDDANLPQFFYRHYPQGSSTDVQLRFRGVSPSGPLPESIDFPVSGTPRADDFEVIWIADPQPQSAVELGFFRDDIVAELVGSDAAFGITVGDLLYDDLALMPRYNRILAQIGIPWYNVPGNHELNFQAPDARLARETFKRYFGPTYYSFDYGKTHFVVLDDVHYLGKDAGRETPHPRGAGKYEGRIDERQLAWLANDLRDVPADHMVVLAMHIPLTSHGDLSKPRNYVANRDELFRIVEDREHVMAVSGHMHTTEHHYFGPEEGYSGSEPFHLHVLATGAGSWWSGPADERGIPTTPQRDGTPNGYHVMTVRGNRLSLRYKAAGKPDDHQMRIVLDTAYHQFNADGLRHFRMGQLLGDRIDLDRVHSTEIVVNLFDGGPRSRVECSVGDGPPVLMQRTSRIDPFIQELFIRYRDTLKPWIEADPSSHIWTAPLPADLGPGAHTITVRAVDEYGQTHTGRKMFEIVAGAEFRDD